MSFLILMTSNKNVYFLMEPLMAQYLFEDTTNIMKSICVQDISKRSVFICKMQEVNGDMGCYTGIQHLNV